MRLLVEGYLDEALLRRTISYFTRLEVHNCYGRQGSLYIRKKIADFSRAAAPQFLLVCLVDLDREACVLDLIGTLLPGGAPPGFLLRVAVKEMEAWLLADRGGMAQFTGAPLDKVPPEPDARDDPKREIVALVRQYGKPSLKKDIVPAVGSSAPVGPGYAPQIIQFIHETWNPDNALVHSRSFARAVQALRQLDTELSGLSPNEE